MSFDWLDDFQQNMKKREDYAAKTLASYRLGMRANGSIAGVRVVVGEQACPAATALDPTAVYHPDEAPHLPLAECDRREDCHCVYRPVMTYQLDADSD